MTRAIEGTLACALLGCYWGVARGQMRELGYRLSMRSRSAAPAIAAAAGISFVALHESALPWGAAAVVPCLAVCALTDIHAGYVFDAVLLLGALAIVPALVAADWARHAGGSLAGTAFLAAPYLLSRGRAIGLGDVKLAALAGAALGWPAIGVALWCAFVAGGAFAAGALAARRLRRGAQVPFAPFLAAGSCIAMLVRVG